VFLFVHVLRPRILGVGLFDCVLLSMCAVACNWVSGSVLLLVRVLYKCVCRRGCFCVCVFYVLSFDICIFVCVCVCETVLLGVCCYMCVLLRVCLGTRVYCVCAGFSRVCLYVFLRVAECFSACLIRLVNFE